MNISTKITNRNLAIILKNYPYFNGEPFFEAELNTLAGSFTNILIFSRHQTSENELTHFKLPSNVSHVNLVIKSSLVTRTKSIVRSIFNGTFLRLINDLKNQNVKIRLLPLKTAMVYDELAMVTEQQIVQELHGIGHVANDFIWYSYWCDDAAYMLALMKAQSKISLAISRTHGFDIYTERHPYRYLPYRAFINKYLDKVICISNHGKQRLQETYPLVTSKFIVFSLGVPNQVLINLPPRSPLRIVSLSSIIPLKNLEGLILALECWNGPMLEWHHLGQGNELDYQRSVIEMAREKLNKNNKVTFEFHGFIAPGLVIEELTTIKPHALVNASIFEGIPVSMMEACSLGIPVIGPRIYGVTEIVVDGLNGFSYFPVNSIEIHNALKRLSSLSETEYETMRFNAYRLQQERYCSHQNHTHFASYLGKMEVTDPENIDL